MTPALISVLLAVAAATLLTVGGNQACRLVLAWSGLRAARGESPAESESPPRVGRLIGHLERIMVAVGLLVGSWEILVAVVALKTVARFKDLDERLNAEYFLIGSLFSLLWAVLVTLAWIASDSWFGLGLASRLAGLG